jgi:hypothetical protein
LVTRFRTELTTSLVAQHVPAAAARHQASVVAQLGGGSGSGSSNANIPRYVRHDFAEATKTVLYVMGAVMGAAALVALRAMPRKRPDATEAPGPGRPVGRRRAAAAE